MKKTSFFSIRIGKLPKGCSLCVKGRKSVLYVTGLCTRRCYFCPLSETKKYKDVVFINELQVDSSKKGLRNIIEEIKKSKSKGVGITGGDPLLRLSRTVNFIKSLKKKFGKNFHIHIYLPLKLVSEKSLKELYYAGLDEIRFHPDLDSKVDWEKIKLAKKYNWSIGLEIPVIPGKKKEIKDLIEFSKNHIEFINLNELEVSETNVTNLENKGFVTKNYLSYGIKGSEELAKEILKYIQKNTKLHAHYCSAKLKDAVQLKNRMKIRAASVKKDYDFVTSEGMLVRGAIYLNNLQPTFGYKEKLKKIQKDKVLKKLEKIKKEIMERYNVPKNLVEIDKVRLRILTGIKVVKELKKELKKLGLVPCIVEEHPTTDNLIVELDKL